MNSDALWESFTRQKGISKDARHSAWCYGSNTPDELLELTLKGVKTATASAYALYNACPDELPRKGDYNIIEDSAGNARCIIQTTVVNIVPFDKVSERQAYKEGEGDKSLEYWRGVHKTFFGLDLAQEGMSFTPDMPVVCEEFELLYTA